MSDDLLSVQLNSGRAYLVPRSLLVRLVRADPERVLLLIAGASDPAAFCGASSESDDQPRGRSAEGVRPTANQNALATPWRG